jgi:membrane-bound ClpP family serine protease
MTANLLMPIILQLLAIGVIIAEFVLPSGGLLTLVALALVGYSLYDVFAHISVKAGMFFVVADIIMIPILIYIGIKILARSPIALKTSLSRASGVFSQDEALVRLIGTSGKTVTDLRPSGKAIIDGKRMDVISAGDYIAHDTEITVAKVDGNRIVVRLKEADKTSPEKPPESQETEKQ